MISNIHELEQKVKQQSTTAFTAAGGILLDNTLREAIIHNEKLQQQVQILQEQLAVSKRQLEVGQELLVTSQETK